MSRGEQQACWEKRAPSFLLAQLLPGVLPAAGQWRLQPGKSPQLSRGTHRRMAPPGGSAPLSQRAQGGRCPRLQVLTVSAASLCPLAPGKGGASRVGFFLWASSTIRPCKTYLTHYLDEIICWNTAGSFYFTDWNVTGRRLVWTTYLLWLTGTRPVRVGGGWEVAYKALPRTKFQGKSFTWDSLNQEIKCAKF